MSDIQKKQKEGITKGIDLQLTIEGFPNMQKVGEVNKLIKKVKKMDTSIFSEVDNGLMLFEKKDLDLATLRMFGTPEYDKYEGRMRVGIFPFQEIVEVGRKCVIRLYSIPINVTV